MRGRESFEVWWQGIRVVGVQNMSDGEHQLGWCSKAQRAPEGPRGQRVAGAERGDGCRCCKDSKGLGAAGGPLNGAAAKGVVLFVRCIWCNPSP